MKTAVLTSPHNFKVVDTEVPVPSNDELLIKTEGCGICGSNLESWEGREWFKYPFDAGAPGHEGWGRIEAVGESVDPSLIGKRVSVLSYNAFAEYDVSKADRAVILPEQIKNKPFPGEPLGCAVNIFKRSSIIRDQYVAVVGVGFLGSLLISLCKGAGATVIAVSRRQFALEIAEKMNADHIIRFDDYWKTVEQVKKITGDELCDRVIEAAGYQSTLDFAGEITGVRGKLIVAGYHQNGLRQINMQMWNWKGIDVINAHERDEKIYVDGINKAVELSVCKRIDIGPLITHQFALDDINEGFRYLKERPEGFMKGIIVNNN